MQPRATVIFVTQFKFAKVNNWELATKLSETKSNHLKQWRMAQIQQQQQQQLLFQHDGD